MRLDISLKQTQKLAMTTELRQSIEILQYNHLELLDFLTKATEENPTLEVDVDEYKIDYLSNNNYSYANGETDEEEDFNYEKFAYNEETLYDYVYEQLIVSNLSSLEMKIGELLLGNMDDNGYIQMDFYKFSNDYKFSFDDVQKVLAVLQNFYPIGICSTNLSECLLKQADYKGFDDVTKSIIKWDLVDLAENRVEFLAGKYSVSNKEIQASFDKIRSLEPKPGKFINKSNNPTKYIIPDIILEVVDEEIVLTLNEESFIRASKNNFYSDLIKSDIDLDAKNYLKDKFKETSWIIKSINQRRETILKVATAICQIQKDYFVHNSYLVPMTMGDVASIVNVHESTISRTCNGKYIQTPNRVIELKEFFSTGMETVDGTVSVEEIKLYIKTAIEAEDKHKPISDQKITDDLNALGYKISRRTVQKYRDSLGILGSSKRKRF